MTLKKVETGAASALPPPIGSVKAKARLKASRNRDHLFNIMHSSFDCLRLLPQRLHFMGIAGALP